MMSEKFPQFDWHQGAKTLELRLKSKLFEILSVCWPKLGRQQTLGRLTKQKKLAAELAYFECRNDDAEEAHDALIELEFKLRFEKGFGK